MSISVAVMSFFFALVLSLIIEAPILNLEKFMTERGRNTKKG
jgi:hypothetical protein